MNAAALEFPIYYLLPTGYYSREGGDFWEFPLVLKPDTSYLIPDRGDIIEIMLLC
jgi:hypothetical protein